MVLEIECPPGFRVAALIGPKGAKIKELKSESGAKIEIDSTPPPKVIISGTDAQVEAASALVSAILHPPSARLTCDKDHARLLIGPGGSVLKRLQAESGARINVDTAADPAAITIEAASQDAVDAAAALVHAITEPAFTIVECSATALTHVIGPHGGKIKELMATTGATLLASGGGPGGAATVRIEGSAAQIAAAEALVRAIIEEEAHPDYAGPEGNRLRAEAEAHAQERSRLMGEADAAFKAEPPDHATGHARAAEAKAAGEAMHASNAAAAAAILRHRNAGKGPRYLDLHGLLVEEAVRATTEKLDELAAAAGGGGGGEGGEGDGGVAASLLELIPGAGHHSAGGKAAIKPAVEALLKERELAFEERVGTLMVKLSLS